MSVLQNMCTKRPVDFVVNLVPVGVEGELGFSIG